MIFKILIFAVCAFVLYRLFMNDRRKHEEKEQQMQSKRVANGELVQDPECGTFVDKETAVTIRDGDKTYYFCCHDCRTKYLEKLKVSSKAS